MGALYEGTVMHARLRPRRHRFRYRVFSLLVDVDRIAEETRGLRFLSHNRPNLLALYERDHGDGSGGPLRPWVLARLRAGGVAGPVGRIALLTFPRVLGRVFAPISLFVAYDPRERPMGVVYEVHNTFGERHAYAMPLAGGGGVEVHRADKAFHVSPFIAMDAEYGFRLLPPGERFSLCIRQTDRDGVLLHASHAARRRPLNDRALLGVVAGYPLMAVGVMAGIMWQALRLWLKGVPVHSHPRKRARPTEAVTAPR